MIKSFLYRGHLKTPYLHDRRATAPVTRPSNLFKVITKANKLSRITRSSPPMDMPIMALLASIHAERKSTIYL